MAPMGGTLAGSGSILEPSELTVKDAQTEFTPERVKCMTIESFCELNGIDRIDCIHIDAQGAELRILSKLGKFRPDCVFAEVCNAEAYKGAFEVSELDSYMESI